MRHSIRTPNTVKPVLSDHIKLDIFLAFQTGGCLLLHESSAENTCRSFLHYFHAAISNHLSIAISMSPEWVVAYNRFNCSKDEDQLQGLDFMPPEGVLKMKSYFQFCI